MCGTTDHFDPADGAFAVAVTDCRPSPTEAFSRCYDRLSVARHELDALRLNTNRVNGGLCADTRLVRLRRTVIHPFDFGALFTSWHSGHHYLI
jgi:hypothetical protein